MSVMIWPAVYPFRLKPGGGPIRPEFPGECEPECRYSDELREHLSYSEFAEYMKRRWRTRDERQCRGCGRWGIFEPRAITASPQMSTQTAHTATLTGQNHV